MSGSDEVSHRFRVGRVEDGAACAAIYRPFVESSAVTFETEVPDATEMSARIVDTLRHSPFLVAEDAVHQVAGYAYANLFRTRAAYGWVRESSIYLAATTRGRGLGRALYTALLDVLRAQGVTRVYAVITVPHPSSEAFHAALGFRACGRLENSKK